MNKVRIRKNKKQEIRDSISTLILLLISIYTLIRLLEEIKVIYLIIIIILIVFFGVGFIFNISGVLNIRPLLSIDEDGITDRSCISSVGLIPWKEIEVIYVEGNQHQRNIGIKLYNLDEFINKVSFLKGINIKINLMRKHAPVSINLDTVDKELYEVVELLQRRLEEYGNNSIQEE